MSLVLVGALLLPATLWAVAALSFDVRIAWLRAPAATLYLLGLLTGWILVKGAWRKMGLTAGAFAVVFGWWLLLEPSAERRWQADVARTAHAEIDGETITIRDIRHAHYRTESDFDVAYYHATFELAALRSADLFMVYWGSPLMAHTMVSFGFADGRHVCFSIETRKEVGETYSAVKGLFRQYELIVVAAEERDVVLLRTNHRVGEEVYLFRLQAPPAQVREFFLSYVRRLNALHARPEWYNALAHNCTTSIRTLRAATDRAPWDWRMLANGLGDAMLYERGAIPTTVPLAELKRRAHINERARAGGDATDFSARIREGIPGMSADEDGGNQ